MNTNTFGSAPDRPMEPPGNLRPPTAQTFEDLEIPASFRAAVEKELTGDEKMLWVGRPSRNPQVHPSNKMLPLIGGGLIVLALGMIVVLLVLSAGVRPGGQGGGNAFGFVFAGVLGVIGLVCLIPLFVNPAKTCRYCYVVTNRRAILVEVSLWQRGPVARSYPPQQLLGLERQDHPAVAGAGDLIFEYEFVLPGNTLNPLTGSFVQQGATAGLSKSPQRVPRGFMLLDQVRKVENLIRTTLLGQLEHALDTPKPAAANGHASERPVQADAGAAAAPVSCREDGSVPADLKEKTLAGLDPNEKPVWIGRPVPKLILLRSGAYLAGGGVGILAALIWLVAALTPSKAAAQRPQPGKQAAAPAKQQTSNPLLPVGLFLVSACVAAVPLVRWRTAARTCYALTNRRALVYKESLFGPTRESYSPLEVSDMQRRDSWLAAGSGDLIFRTVQVVSRTRTGPGRSSASVKTIHYGFLAIAELGAVEKLVRETLIDRFVDKLTQANAA